MRFYEYRHIVSFEETNLDGNVYYVNHIRWQGLCREMFIRDHAPGVLTQLSNGLSLVTVRCSCNYLAEIFAFEEIVIRMWLADISQNRMTMAFEYVRQAPSARKWSRVESSRLHPCAASEMDPYRRRFRPSCGRHYGNIRSGIRPSRPRDTQAARLMPRWPKQRVSHAWSMPDFKPKSPPRNGPRDLSLAIYPEIQGSLSRIYALFLTRSPTVSRCRVERQKASAALSYFNPLTH